MNLLNSRCRGGVAHHNAVASEMQDLLDSARSRGIRLRCVVACERQRQVNRARRTGGVLPDRVPCQCVRLDDSASV